MMQAEIETISDNTGCLVLFNPSSETPGTNLQWKCGATIALLNQGLRSIAFLRSKN